MEVILIRAQVSRVFSYTKKTIIQLFLSDILFSFPTILKCGWLLLDCSEDILCANGAGDLKIFYSFFRGVSLTLWEPSVWSSQGMAAATL